MFAVLDTEGYDLTPASVRKLMAQTRYRHGYCVSVTEHAVCYADGSTVEELEGVSGTATTGCATDDAMVRISRCTCISDRSTS